MESFRKVLNDMALDGVVSHWIYTYGGGRAFCTHTMNNIL
jgi:hypothetical protein